MKNSNIKITKIFFILGLFLLSLVSFNFKGSVHAEEGPGIAAAPQYTPGQISKDGIFNVNIKNNKKYVFIIKLSNYYNKNKVVTIEPYTAYTSDAGAIVFNQKKAPTDSTLKNDFRSRFPKKTKKIKVPANSSILVPYQFNMPKKHFEGIMAGGFNVYIPNDTKLNRKNNLSVNNRYTYGLSAIVHDSNKKAVPKLTLGGSKPFTQDDQLYVNTKIRNIKPAIISGMNVDATINKVGQNKILAHTKTHNGSMAPNSYYPFKNVMLVDSLSSGLYHVHMKVTDDAGNTWILNKNFRVTLAQAFTHFLSKNPLILYILIALIIILILVIAYLIYRHYRNKKAASNK